MMPAIKGLDPANLRANLCKTTDPAKKVLYHHQSLRIL